MHIFYTLILSLFLLLILILLRNHKLISDKPSHNIRKIHTETIIKIGGIMILSSLTSIYFVENSHLQLIIIFGVLFFLIGLSADLFLNFTWSYRFIIMLLLLIIIVSNFNFIIINFDHKILNQIILSSSILPYVFVVAGYLFIINGFNFIDGNNGLMLGVGIIILLNFKFYTDFDFTDLHLLYNILISSCLLLFIINFITGKIITGDCGAYFLGFVIGSLGIYLANVNLLFATQVACLIFYPINELFISFWRRIIINKSNPFKPDDQHLHSLLHKLIIKKIKENKKYLYINNNSLTSAIILICFIISSIFVYLFADFTGYMIMYFVLSATQLLIYIIISKQVKNY